MTNEIERTKKLIEESMELTRRANEIMYRSYMEIGKMRATIGRLTEQAARQRRLARELADADREMRGE